MKLSHSRRGVAPVVILVALAILGGVTWLAKPALFPGASRRAKNSTQTTKELIAAKDAPAAANAASATVIARAVNDVPDSPATSFIRNEIPIILARSPQPDPAELLQAERRRVAFMEGKLEEQRRLTAIALKDAAALAERADKAEAAKAASDLALEQAAAAEHARSVQFVAASSLALLALAAAAYFKFYGISLPTLGKMAAGIRAGEDPIAVMTELTPPWHHARVQKHARLASDLPSNHERPAAAGSTIPFPNQTPSA